MPGYGHGLVNGVFFDQAQELAASGHIAPLAHVDEAASVAERFESRKPGRHSAGIGAVRLVVYPHLAGQRRYMLRGGAATPSGNIHYAFGKKRLHGGGEVGGGDGITSHAVGKAGIGIEYHCEG